MSGFPVLLISTRTPLLPPTWYALSLQTEAVGDVPEGGSCRVTLTYGLPRIVRLCVLSTAVISFLGVLCQPLLQAACRLWFILQLLFR